MQPVTPPPAKAWGLDPVINPAVTRRCQWDAGPFKYFIKILEVVTVKDEESRKVMAKHPNPFQVGDMVVRVVAQPAPSDPIEGKDETYLVAEIILGGYCKVVNTEKLEGVVIHARWLKPFNT